ncbi:unnamed protein product [Arctogadus glacialis]
MKVSVKIHKDRLHDLYPKDRLHDLYPKDRLHDLYPKDRLHDLYPKDRLHDLYPKDRLHDLYPKDRLHDLYPESVPLGCPDPGFSCCDLPTRERRDGERDLALSSSEHGGVFLERQWLPRW